MEVSEDNHRVEVRVYSQKVKHLEYEHSISLKTIAGETTTLLEDETTDHGAREASMRIAKDALKMEKKEKEFEHAAEIQEMKLVRCPRRRVLSFVWRVFRVTFRHHVRVIASCCARRCTKRTLLRWMRSSGAV